MRKPKQHPATPAIDPAELTKQIHAIGSRLPEIDDTLARIEPEVAIARALGDDARIAFVEDRMARLQAERVDLERRHAELLVTMQAELDRKLTEWRRDRWDPAIAEIRAERARRVAECAAAGEAFVTALERLKEHPAEVMAQAEALQFGERSNIVFAHDSVQPSVDAPGWPAERELAQQEFDQSVESIRQLLDDERRLQPGAVILAGESLRAMPISAFRRGY